MIYKKGDEVQISEYIDWDGEEIRVSSPATVLEDAAEDNEKVFVRIDDVGGEPDVSLYVPKDAIYTPVKPFW